MKVICEQIRNYEFLAKNIDQWIPQSQNLYDPTDVSEYIILTSWLPVYLGGSQSRQRKQYKCLHFDRFTVKVITIVPWALAFIGFNKC